MSEEINTQLQVLEAALFTSDEPLSVDKLSQLFEKSERPNTQEIRALLAQVQEAYTDRAVELIEVGSGYRFQAKADYADALKRLWEKKPPRYSRALMETLALIAYRQPITRGEIEDVRGVVVSSHTIKTLMERDWIKIAGHRDVPGKPALFATTKAFLDYFNLKKLSDLPALSELVDFESLEKQLGLQLPSADNQKAQDSTEESGAMSEVCVEKTTAVQAEMSHEVGALQDEATREIYATQEEESQGMEAHHELEASSEALEDQEAKEPLPEVQTA